MNFNGVKLNESSPKVSVIIPLYNQKQYVGEAIDSVINQTYPNIEVIVVNDGSTDNPLPFLEKYQKGIMLINQENMGLAAARNAGIRKSTGEYIQFLDADDFLHKDKIKLHLEFCIAENCEVSYCEISQYDNDTGNTELRYVGEVKDMFPRLYNFWHTYPLPVHSMLIKKELFDKFGLFDEELTACEDRYFFSKLSSEGISFKYFPFIGGFRRQHKSNMNKDRLHIVRNTIRFYKKINGELGDSYFIKRFSYPGHEMMSANLTYVYLINIGEGTCSKYLKNIRKLLSKENIKFNAGPIPSGFKKFKQVKLFLVFYLRRCFKFLHSHLFCSAIKN